MYLPRESHLDKFGVTDQVSLKEKSLLGNDLLSQGAAPQVPSALTSLTAGFGMGPGVSSSLKSPKDLSYKRNC